MDFEKVGKALLATFILSLAPLAVFAGQAAARDTLAQNQTLRAPAELRSGDGQYTLAMQQDGNLVAYDRRGQPVWSSETAGSGAVECVMQGDGNLVLRGRNGRAVWSTRTEGARNARLMIQNDGNVVIYNGRGLVVWAKGRIRDSLSRDENLLVDEFIRSQNRNYTLILQGDGNLVARDERGKSLWNSNTVGSGAAECRLQGDGNLLLKDRNGRTVWASNTEGHNNARLLIQDDGLLVLYSEAGETLWANGNLGPDIRGRDRLSPDVQGVDRDSRGYRADTGDAEFDRSLDNLNRVAGRYPEDFTDRLSDTFRVSKVWIDGLLKTDGLPPADVYLIAKMAAVTNRPLSAVERVYRSERGQGWEAIARRLGISPGSDAWQALKQDDAGFFSMERGPMRRRNESERN